MYDTLLMLLGSYQVDCWAPDAVMFPWPAIWMADWARAMIDDAQFLQLMGFMGDTDFGGQTYSQAAQCMVDIRNK